jgi:hypothetical protein
MFQQVSIESGKPLLMENSVDRFTDRTNTHSANLAFSCKSRLTEFCRPEWQGWEGHDDDVGYEI